MADEDPGQEPTTPPEGQEPEGEQQEPVQPSEPEGEQQDSFDREYVEKLRQEAAKYRTQLRELEAAEEERQSEREAAEQKRLEEQQKFQELYEKEKAKREAAEAQRQALELTSLKRRVADEVGLPKALAERLQGETEEDITADAKALLKTLPRPDAPNLDGGAGKGGKGAGNNAPTWQEIQEQAAQFGVNARFLAEQYGVTPPASK